MKRYVIRKNTRLAGPITLESGYSGPACDEADVEPGKVYHNKEQAERDAVKLAKVNPVGFTVVEVK